MLPQVRPASVLAVLLLSLSSASCTPAVARSPKLASPAPAAESLPYDRLYFGRAIPGGGIVSEAEWEMFLREIVTPLFPAGLTTWRALGQWQDKSSGAVVQEESFVLELIHPTGIRPDSAVVVVVREYKSRFRQQSVMRVQDQVQVSF